jgi:hypothetical protein
MGDDRGACLVKLERAPHLLNPFELALLHLLVRDRIVCMYECMSDLARYWRRRKSCKCQCKWIFHTSNEIHKPVNTFIRAACWIGQSQYVLPVLTCDDGDIKSKDTRKDLY